MAGLLGSVFNHLVLPPKLPGRQDADIESVEHDILSRLLHACETLGTLPGQEREGTWHSVRRQLVVCRDLNCGSFDRMSLISAFSNLSNDYPVTLHIAEQNCAIVIRSLRPGYVFENFLKERGF